MMLILLTFVLPGGIVAGVRRIKARVIQIVPQPPPGANVPPAGTPDVALASVADDDESAPSTPVVEGAEQSAEDLRSSATSDGRSTS
jgi:hypothetical protein